MSSAAPAALPRRPILDEPIDYVIGALIVAAVGGGLTLYLTGQLAGILFKFAWPHATVGQTLQRAVCDVVSGLSSTDRVTLVGIGCTEGLGMLGWARGRTQGVSE